MPMVGGLENSWMWYRPISDMKPSMEEQPGPPAVMVVAGGDRCQLPGHLVGRRWRVRKLSARRRAALTVEPRNHWVAGWGIQRAGVDVVCMLANSTLQVT